MISILFGTGPRILLAQGEVLAPFNISLNTRQYDSGWTREKVAGEVPKAPSKIQQRKSQLYPLCRRLSHYWQVQRGVRRRGETTRGAIYERKGARTFTGKDPHHAH